MVTPPDTREFESAVFYSGNSVLGVYAIDAVELLKCPTTHQKRMVVVRKYRVVKDRLDRRAPSPRLAFVQALQGGQEL